MGLLVKLTDKWRASNALPLATLGWGYLAYAAALRVSGITTPPVCLFHLITGIPCPLCGMTRAFGCVFSGQFSEAVRFNHLAFVFLAAWLAITLISTVRIFENDSRSVI